MRNGLKKQQALRDHVLDVLDNFAADHQRRRLRRMGEDAKMTRILAARIANSAPRSISASEIVRRGTPHAIEYELRRRGLVSGG